MRDPRIDPKVGDELAVWTKHGTKSVRVTGTATHMPEMYTEVYFKLGSMPKKVKLSDWVLFTDGSTVVSVSGGVQ